MKVVHVNVRLNEGGAAQIALDLHRRLPTRGHESEFFYGYGANARPSPDQSKIERAYPLGERMQVIANFGLHRACGIELFSPWGGRANTFKAALADADVIHLHATHSYYLPFQWLLPLLRDLGKPIVWTAHDFWLVTGRCAFLEGCSEWKNGCGACPTTINYPPTRFDFSRRVFFAKRTQLQKIEPLTTLVAPSMFVGDVLKEAFPTSVVQVVRNGLDSNFEIAARAIKFSTETSVACNQISVVVVANDLSDQTKTNPRIVSQLLATPNIVLRTVGRNSPFSGTNVVNYGEVKDRQRLVAVLTSSDYLLFTSRKDTFGLVMAEALSCGTCVLAVDSDAAREVLGSIGAKCLRSETLDLRAILDRSIRAICGYPATDEALRDQALSAFSGDVFLEKYLDVYRAATACHLI